MPGMAWDDEIDDALDEYVDDEEDSDADLLVCPSCGKPVHEDTQQCPHCRDWITPVDSRSGWKNWIWIIAAVLVVAGFLLPAILRLR